jgi:hypothetical protein
LRIAPRLAAAHVAGARRSATRPSQSATTALAVASSARAMPARFHGPRTAPQNLRHRCRPKSECLLRIFPHSTPGALFATSCTSRIVSKAKRRTTNPLLLAQTMAGLRASKSTTENLLHRATGETPGMDHPGFLQSTRHHPLRRVNLTRASITTLLRAWARAHLTLPLLPHRRSTRSLPLRSATRDHPMSSVRPTRHPYHHRPRWLP